MAASAEEYEDDYDEYYDDDEEGVSGFVVLVVAVVVLVVFAAVVWFAYQRGIQQGSTPVIAANPEPARIEQPVEFAANETNQEVYDTLEGNTRTEVIVDTSDERDPLEGFSQTTSAATGETTGPAVSEREPASANANPPQVTSEPEPEPAPVTREPVQQDPEPQVTPPASSEPATPVTTTSASGALAGTHLVQVGAFRSDAEAQTYFSSMQSRFSTLLSGKAPDVQRADLGSRGIYYRLRVGPFDSKSAADNYCARLKAGGQDCLVKPV